MWSQGYCQSHSHSHSCMQNSCHQEKRGLKGESYIHRQAPECTWDINTVYWRYDILLEPHLLDVILISRAALDLRLWIEISCASRKIPLKFFCMTVPSNEHFWEPFSRGLSLMLSTEHCLGNYLSQDRNNAWQRQPALFLNSILIPQIIYAKIYICFQGKTA